MMRGEKQVVPIQICLRYIRGQALFRVHEYEPRTGLNLHVRQDLTKAHPRPVIVKPAPARDAVNIAVRIHLGRALNSIQLQRTGVSTSP